MKHPGQDFVANLGKSVEPGWRTHWRRHYRAYNDALMLLDNESWAILKSKAIAQFANERAGQRKQPFFNQLNEAFAYRYLLRQGLQDVRFLEEARKRTPDIRFIDGAKQNYCEVKTVGISEDEIGRRKGKKAYNGAIYQNLSPGFLNKLGTDIGEAWTQIHAVGTDGLVFILVRFDDIALDYYNDYRTQLIKFCRTHQFRNLVIKVGHLGRKRISIL